VNYAKLLEMTSFFTWHIFLEVGKTQDLPSNLANSYRCSYLGGFLSFVLMLLLQHLGGLGYARLG
jgi:hypothetical protein